MTAPAYMLSSAWSEPLPDPPRVHSTDERELAICRAVERDKRQAEFSRWLWRLEADWLVQEALMAVPHVGQSEAPRAETTETMCSETAPESGNLE